MSKTNKSKDTEVDVYGGDNKEDNSPPGTAVDFIFQTMISRAGVSGKRQIRPKNVDELLLSAGDIPELGSDEDPDFDVSKDKHHNESDLSIASDDEGDSNKGDEDDDDKGSMDANAEDSDEDDDDYTAGHSSTDGDDGSGDDDSGSNDEEDSDDEEDSQSPSQKRSALRETLQKLNDADYNPQANRKRKRPRKAGGVKRKSASKSDGSPRKSKSSRTKKDGEKKPRGKIIKGKKKSTDAESNSKIKNKPKRKKKIKLDASKTVFGMVSQMETSQKENRNENTLGSPICSACLGKASDDSNEIVECDSCCITVHEACYGVSDTLSVSSGTGSSCSTEPWFCDACRNGAVNISCELCPVQGGLFKETSAGRWVHLVCALYTPGVLITENGFPSLFDIPYAKWGAHSCSLCTDTRFSRSGITIPCDAGMCRTFLHATCAQKSGLLSDPVPYNSDKEADPFFAACKLHTSRETAKRRGRCYAVLQEQLRIKREQKTDKDQSPEEHATQLRIQRKLEKIRFKIAIKQAHSFTNPLADVASTSIPLTTANVQAHSSNFPPPPDLLPPNWKSSKKMRLLPTSAGTALAFYRKAYLMGLDVPALELEDKHDRIVASVKKKWNIQPGMSVEYAAYYADREKRINALLVQCERAQKENMTLNNQQVNLQDAYDVHDINNELLGEDTKGMRDTLLQLTSVVKSICLPENQKLFGTVTELESKTQIKPTQRRGSPSRSKGRMSPPKHVKKLQRKISATPSTPSERLAIKSCSVCNKSEDQPWIIRCDQCKKLYHLRCLDPPLTRLPKRSRQCGWMCSDCGEEQEELEAEEPHVDENAPRTLRGRTKIRKPGKYRTSTDSREEELKIDVDVDHSNEVIIANTSVSESKNGSPDQKMANGTPKKVPRKRASGSSTMTSPGLLSPSSLSFLSASVEPPTSSASISTPPTPLLPGQKPKRKYVRKKPKIEVGAGASDQLQNSVSLSGPTVAATDDGGQSPSKAKKPRVRKLKEPKAEVQVIEAFTEDGISTAPTAKKPKIPKAEGIKSLTPKVPKIRTPKPPKVPKVSIKTEINSSEEIQLQPALPSLNGPLNSVEIVVKKKRPRKPKSIVDEAGNTVVCLEGNNKKPKKPKKSLEEIQRINKEKQERKKKIKMSMMAAAAAAVKKTDDSFPGPVFNGQPKKVRKRKSKTGDPTKDGVVPPKKRKRKVSTITAVGNASGNHYDVTNAVSGSSGTFDGQQNGIALSTGPDGILMRGVAPMKSNWSNTTSEVDDHSIMKGHAMGASTNTGEVVTVNANDLLDMVYDPSSAPVKTTANVTTYSPGFYSSSAPDSSTPVALATDPSSLPASPPRIEVNQIQKQATPTTTQEQNVIKLIYQSSDATSSTGSTATFSTAASALPVVVTATNSLIATATAYTNSATMSSEPSGKCSACIAMDFKKNMVTCDKCALDFHFQCLTPPLKYSPRRRNYAWYCSRCDQIEAQGVSAAPQKLPSFTSQFPQSEAPSQPSSKVVHIAGNDLMRNIMRTFNQK